jgi:subtilisin family serine protease
VTLKSPAKTACAVATTIAALTMAASGAMAQVLDTVELERLARTFRHEVENGRTAVYRNLLQNPDAAQRVLNETPGIQLMYMRPSGQPVFYREHNLNAAKTVRAYDVWPGPVGLGNYGVDGSTTSAGELGVWDGAGVRLTHQEFNGRVTQVDGPIAHGQHSTHVAGTMISAGLIPNARGMSYGSPSLYAYDWFSDTAEMALAGANGMQISNHSYGFATGWENVSGSWYWYGDIGVSASEDYGFGFYDSSARQYDLIARNAPNYLICVSAGNDPNDGGAGPGGAHFHWSGGWTMSNDSHGTDYQSGGFDTISWTATAKNILTVGAINDIAAGYTQPADVSMLAFSSWGPCDDGRIKPDIVANGNSLSSTNNAADNGYASLSGTSMSSPSAAGSANLIAQDFETVRGTTPWSATVKALIINGADEAGGNDGPDYAYGWGLMNVNSALDVVHAGPADDLGVIEGTLLDGQTDEYYFSAYNAADLRVTLVWTDPAASVLPPSLDPSSSRLVNDLDVVLEDVGIGTTVYPWVLSGALPANAPTQAVNHVDNVEQVDFYGAPSGGYKVTVSHTGNLSGGQQNYALVWRGMRENVTPVRSAVRVPAIWIGDPRPNPVSGVATIDYGLDNDQEIAIHVYDVAGRLVRTLLERSSRAAGTGTVGFDTGGLASGVYFVRMESRSHTTTKKITVVK